MYETNTVLRHTPKQQRGQRKVEHILRSAEALFAEIGYENATTNAIAARAGVSIGSLYQFFSSKETILEAIAGRYLEQTRLALSRVLDVRVDFRLEDTLTHILETLIKLQEQRPYFLQCLSQSRPTPALAVSVAGLKTMVATLVASLLDQGLVQDDPKLLMLRARVCVETIGALLPVALHARGRERTAVIRETRTMLMRYLEPTLSLEGVA